MAKEKKEFAKKIGIYISPTTARVLGPYDEGEGASRVEEIIDRYGEIMRRIDRELESALSEAEINAIAAVIKDTTWQPAALIDGGIVTDLEDSGKNALAGKVRGLTFAQQVAIVERVRRIMRRGDK